MDSLLETYIGKVNLMSLIERFSVNQRILAEMFGVSVSTLARTIKRFGLNVLFVKGRSPNEEQYKEYMKFLNPSPEDETDEAQLHEDEPVLVEQEQVEELSNQDEADDSTPMRMKEIRMSFGGKLSVDAIANSLKVILGNNTYGEMEIICKIQ